MSDCPTRKTNWKACAWSVGSAVAIATAMTYPVEAFAMLFVSIMLASLATTGLGT